MDYVTLICLIWDHLLNSFVVNYQMIGQCSFFDMDITMAITRALVGSCQWDKVLQLMAVLQVRRPLCVNTAPIMSS